MIPSIAFQSANDYGLNNPAVHFQGRKNKVYHGYYIPEKEDFVTHINHAYSNQWSPERFAWHMDVRQNLRNTLEAMSPAELTRVARMALPLVEGFPKDRLQKVMTEGLPTNPRELAALKEVIVTRQFQGLQDVANHAATNEQGSVSPLSKGLIRYKRYPAIQEAVSIFVSDEAKHSGVFRRYLKEKLHGEEKVLYNTVDGFEKFDKLSRVMPGGAVFLALAVEVVGGAFFEFFAQKAPDPLFRQMCDTIAKRDEQRHMAICQALYRELYKTGSPWEKFRNNVAMKMILREVYGPKADPNHYLMQACRSFGVEPQELFDYVSGRVEQEFAKIGFKFDAKSVIKGKQ